MENSSPHFAGFWKRALSGLIDIAIISLVSYFLYPHEPFGRISLWISIAVLYYAISWSQFSGTIGNYLLGQRLVNEKLEKPTTGEILIRVIMVILFECFWCLPFISIAFNAKKQGWHDRIAKTFVIETPNKTV
jgi:uncharacterized RDD family membrane protein YckC